MEEQAKYENLPAEQRANMLSDQKSMLFNVALFEHAQRIAKLYASSDMVPSHFRQNIGNCFIALNYAHRIGADEFMVMQNMYVVHGRPGLEGKLVIALVNQSKKYKHPGLKYEIRGDITKPGKEADGIRAYAIDAQTGERVDGPWITWATVNAEGWYSKKGPSGSINDNKWRTMPEVMFTYRAASWFANKNCPEVKMGMATVEELQDVINVYETAPGKYEQPETTEDLEARILKKNGERPAPTIERENFRPYTDKEMVQGLTPEQGGSVKLEKTGPENMGSIEDQWRQSELYRSFDPLNEQVGKRYAAAKQQKIIDMLAATNQDFNPDSTGADLHQQLLDFYAADPQQTSDAVQDQEPDDTPESEALKLNKNLQENWYEFWEEAANYLRLEIDKRDGYSDQTLTGWNSRISRLVDQFAEKQQ